MIERLQKIIDDAAEAMEQLVSELTPLKNEDVGLDRRAGTVYAVGTDQDGYIIVANDHNNRALVYYGGFEYVDHENVTVIGRYVLYSSKDSRVEGHLSYLEEEVE